MSNMKKKIHWTKIKLYCGESDPLDAETAIENPDLMEQLDEYRRTNSINDYFMLNEDGSWTIEDGSLGTWNQDGTWTESPDRSTDGPKVHQIDWTGFPETP